MNHLSVINMHKHKKSGRGQNIFHSIVHLSQMFSALLLKFITNLLQLVMF